MINSRAAAGNALVAAFERGLAFCNNIIVVFAALALIAACAHPELQRAEPRAVSQRQLLAG